MESPLLKLSKRIAEELGIVYQRFGSINMPATEPTPLPLLHWE